MKVIDCFNFALSKYRYKHNGELPVKIFVSSPLFKMFESEMHIDCRIRKGEWVYEFQGVPIVIYTSNEFEYYFADYCGEFWEFK